MWLYGSVASKPLGTETGLEQMFPCNVGRGQPSLHLILHPQPPELGKENTPPFRLLVYGRSTLSGTLNADHCSHTSELLEKSDLFFQPGKHLSCAQDTGRNVLV